MAGYLVIWRRQAQRRVSWLMTSDGTPRLAISTERCILRAVDQVLSYVRNAFVGYVKNREQRVLCFCSTSRIAI